MARTRSLVVASDGDLVVERDRQRPTGRLLRQDDMDASYVDLDDPRHLEFDYLRWARLVLTAFGARHVVHVGGAACTLARAMLAQDAGSRHEVLELDERVLEIARAHLGLRRQPGLKVRVADGRAALATRADASADAVVIDAFLGARVPRHLVTAEALGTCARIAPLAVVNVVDTAGWHNARAIAAGLGESYAHVGGLGSGSRRGGNLLLFGAAETPPRQRLEGAAAADRSPARWLGVEDLAGSAAWTDQVDSSSTSASSERNPAAIGSMST
jgi:hypothetical protein